MAALILPSRRVVQPQGPVEVDDSNAIAFGLRDCILPAGGRAFMVRSGTALTPGTTFPPVYSSYGIATADNGGNSGFSKLWDSPGNTVDATVLAVAQVTSSTSVTAGRAAALSQSATGADALAVLTTDGASPGVITAAAYVGGARRIFGSSFTLSEGENFTSVVRHAYNVGQDLWVNGKQDPNTLAQAGTMLGTGFFGRRASLTPLYFAAAWKRALNDSEIRSVSENPWQLFRPIQRRIIVDLGAGGTGATASATPATVTTAALTATATGSASASATPAQVTAAPATATATGSASAQATPADASATPATGIATGAALASSTPASVQLTSATATASGEAGASVEATATPAPITTATATATATGSASAQATPDQVTTTAPTATAASGISASATLAAIGLMPTTGVATGGAIASAIPAQIIITPSQATAAGSAWAFSAPAQISTTPATGSASEYIKPLYSEDPSAQFVGYPVDDHSVDYPLRLMAVNYPFDTNKVDFPLRVLRVNYPKQ